MELKWRTFPKKEIEARVQEAARILGITELLERRPKALSGSQRQRVAVGRTIVRKPAMFLFDVLTGPVTVEALTVIPWTPEPSRTRGKATTLFAAPLSATVQVAPSQTQFFFR